MDQIRLSLSLSLSLDREDFAVFVRGLPASAAPAFPQGSAFSLSKKGRHQIMSLFFFFSTEPTDYWCEDKPNPTQVAWTKYIWKATKEKERKEKMPYPQSHDGLSRYQRICRLLHANLSSPLNLEKLPNANVSPPPPKKKPWFPSPGNNEIIHPPHQERPFVPDIGTFNGGGGGGGAAHLYLFYGVFRFFFSLSLLRACMSENPVQKNPMDL